MWRLSYHHYIFLKKEEPKIGLDSNLYRVPADFIKGQPWTDVDVDECLKDGDMTELKYWRKHGQLQNWMHNRYNEYGGVTEDFNCVYLRLFEHDFEKLLSDLKSGNMPNGDGFFFGESTPDKIFEDIEYFEGLMPKLNFTKYAYLYEANY